MPLREVVWVILALFDPIINGCSFVSPERSHDRPGA